MSDPSPKAPAWVASFFDTATSWWSAPQVDEDDHTRVADLERLCGPGPHRILDLGAGAGTTARALTDAGHEVTALELSPVRANLARVLATGTRMEVVEGDFFTVDLVGRYSVVTCWNGFGIGSDRDQRSLLARIARDWLAQDGAVLVDVFSPWRWARIAGQEERLDTYPDGTVRVPALVNKNDFDPTTSRFLDSWWPDGAEHLKVTQSARCYTPADFRLLVEGTGLHMVRCELDGQDLDGQDLVSTPGAHPLLDAWEYRTLLTAGPA